MDARKQRQKDSINYHEEWAFHRISMNYDFKQECKNPNALKSNETYHPLILY